MFTPITTSFYKLPALNFFICTFEGNQTDLDCERGDSLSNYIFLFVGGQLLHSVGGMAIYTIGPVYLDENAPASDGPLYMGILGVYMFPCHHHMQYCDILIIILQCDALLGMLYASAALGAALAFVAGGLLLGVYVDIGRVDLGEYEILFSFYDM